MIIRACDPRSSLAATYDATTTTTTRCHANYEEEGGKPQLQPYFSFRMTTSVLEGQNRKGVQCHTRAFFFNDAEGESGCTAGEGV